jgi:hypothetical protein
MRGITAVVATTLSAVAMVGEAQVRTPEPAAAKTVVGCVERAQRTGSLAGTAVGTSASPNTAPQEANSGEPVEAFMLTGASAKDADRAVAPTSYALEGHEAEFANHTGHRIEVTGKLAPPRSSGRGASQNPQFAAGVQRLQVESFKMLAPNCSTRTK